MTVIVAVLTAILGNYVPLLGPNGWVLTMILGAYCALALLDRGAQPVEYARRLGKTGINRKKQEGYRKRSRWLWLACVMGAILTSMAWPQLDLVALMLLSFVLGRMAVSAYDRIDLILTIAGGVIAGMLLSIIGLSLQDLPFLSHLRPSFAMGTISNPLFLALELSTYLVPCVFAFTLIALTRPKTLTQLETKFGQVEST